MTDRIAAVKAHPKYQELVRRRTRFGWSMTAIILGIVLTAVYVRRANSEYDALLQAVLDDTSE